MGPEGFDPSICGSEDHRDILATLRTLCLELLKLDSTSISIELINIQYIEEYMKSLNNNQFIISNISQ